MKRKLIIKIGNKNCRENELMPFREFKAGSIHTSEVLEFWEKELKASDWILNTLKKGYLIPFRENPTQYEEGNNKTVRENMKITRGILADMISKQVVHVVKEKPFCVNPLGLVSRMQDNGQMKHRLVLDVSRHVNRYIDVPHVRLSHLDRAIELTQEGDYQLIFDLVSAYYHIKIEESQQKFLGAAFQNSDGTTVYVQYAHLPFGISSAVHGITKLWKPITRHLNSKGIRNSIFIDDGRILAISKEEAERVGKIVYNVVTQAGWAIEASKSDKVTEAAREKKYLGFLLNTEKMEIKATGRKLEKTEKAIRETLEREEIPIKHLARVLGLIVSLEPSHGMATRISTRSGYATVAEHTERQGWRGTVQLKNEVKRELKFFLDGLHTRNGSPIRAKMREVRLEMILENPIAKTTMLPYHKDMEKIFVSDASDKKVFVYDLDKAEATVLEANFTQEQIQWASGARELLGLVFTLRQWKIKGNMENTNIYWVTDSENMVTFVKKGSRKGHIQDLVFEIAQLASELGIRIEPIHVLRQDPRIEKADEGSKTPDTDNWSIDAWSFEMLQSIEKKSFDTDLFADANNKRADRFFSLFYSEGTKGIDAFAQDWEKLGNLWICPPISQLIRVHRRIKNSRCGGLVVLPEWETSTFLRCYLEESGEAKFPYKLIRRWQPYIIQNENARNTALFGRPNFNFVALSFNTKVLKN